MSFWRDLVEQLSGGEAAFVAAVADHTRHSPGTRGAKMFVRADGSQVGTIGGGAMEATIIERAADALARSTLSLDSTVLHHRADAEGERSGLICAGRQTMVYWVASPDDIDVYREFLAARRTQTACALHVDDGAASLREEALGTPIQYEDGRYAEHAVNHRRIAIAGGGHCGLALSQTMHQLGYHITVFDTRADLFTLADNAFTNRIEIVADYAEMGAMIDYPDWTHCVVMTADFPSDVRALIGLVDVPAPFKGVMGSSAKLACIREELVAAGAESLFDELYAPVGLPMTSNTPAEIAVSVAAQILAEREKLFEWERPAPM